MFPLLPGVGVRLFSAAPAAQQDHRLRAVLWTHAVHEVRSNNCEFFPDMTTLTFKEREVRGNPNSYSLKGSEEPASLTKAVTGTALQDAVV